MISSRTIALAILIQIAVIGSALAQAVDPEVPPPPAPASGGLSSGTGAVGGAPAPPIIATDPLVDVSALNNPGAVTLSATEVDELRAMCSQREDWRSISVCVRLRP
jgi:hypothetical protein